MFERNIVPLKILNHGRWPPEIMMVPFKCSFEIKMVASALLRNSVFIEKWLAATTFVKYCTLKKVFPAINYKEKMFFRSNYSTLHHNLFL